MLKLGFMNMTSKLKLNRSSEGFPNREDQKHLDNFDSAQCVHGIQQ